METNERAIPDEVDRPRRAGSSNVMRDPLLFGSLVGIRISVLLLKVGGAESRYGGNKHED